MEALCRDLRMSAFTIFGDVLLHIEKTNITIKHVHYCGDELLSPDYESFLWMARFRKKFSHTTLNCP